MKRPLPTKDILPRIASLFVWVVLLLPFSVKSQDTTALAPNRHQQLGTIVVSRDRRPSATLSQAPVQIVEIEKMERNGAILLSDAVRQMAGVTLRDYGGIGGMKTVSARGLGSQFSTLTIDGVAVNDCQNGQVDLGRYTLGGSAYVSLSNGLPDELLITARSVAAGNVINLESQVPMFMPGERTHASFGLEGGSFGLLSPTLAIQQKISRKLFLTLSGNYLQSNGDYPFTLFYTSSHNDSSSVERRQHSAMKMGTGDINLLYDISNNQSLSAKIHYVQGHHELPGPVVMYAKKGSEETSERLFFAQAKYTAKQQHWRFQLIGKYQYSYDKYEDFKAMTASRYLMNEYGQQEAYLSGNAAWTGSSGLSFAVATDAAINALESNLAKNSNVDRLSWLSSLTAQYKTSRVTVKTNLLATLINENACDNPETINYRRLSPYAGISLRPLKKSGVRLRYFYKDTYRAPNFSEMYFFVMPLDTLRPERARQHNIGVTIPLTERFSNDSMHHRIYSLTVDGYRNRVSDKILAVPRQNMFIWSTMNLGLVEITGLDVRAAIDWTWSSNSLSFTFTYSYQKALDHTDPANSKTYNNQIPYTPRHSGGLAAYLHTRWIDVGYNCMLVGERYYQQQNTDNTRLRPYADHSVSLNRTFELPIGELTLQAQVLNLLNVQYEVVRSYPMMGRNFRIKAVYSF